MRVEIWSDIACPWCYVGKRRFESALAQFAHKDEVEVSWHSFLLDPHAPADHGEPQDVLLARKYGCSLEEARAMDERMTQEAAKEGLTFRFDLVRVGSTVPAHRLLHLAESKGLGQAMMERLMKAYLEEGVLMSDEEALVRLATEVGISECDVRHMFMRDDYVAEVQEDLAMAERLGIRSVPFFVLDGKYGVAGAQPAESFLKVLNEVWAKNHPLQMVGTGDACGPDGCAV
ncbi:DsbA family oxidoreductase [bacterium]|nr:MAG: DsbA family oxidoreductase [bacterium]